MAKIIKFDEVTSTNDVAKELGEKGAEHFTCVVANKQTKGRGRRGKIWLTVSNKSIACSTILRTKTNELLPLVASLSVHETLSKYLKCSIKWPNDILVDGKKICGILAEKIGSAENAFYVLGIGINVYSLSHNDLNEIVGTSIEDETGVKVKLENILDELLMNLENKLKENDSSILDAYRYKCSTLGKMVTWNHETKSITGKAHSLTDTGSLLLETENGELHEILSGEIIDQGTG